MFQEMVSPHLLYVSHLTQKILKECICTSTTINRDEMEDCVTVSNIAKLAMIEPVNSNYVDVLFFGSLFFFGKATSHIGFSYIQWNSTLFGIKFIYLFLA